MLPPVEEGQADQEVAVDELAELDHPFQTALAVAVDVALAEVLLDPLAHRFQTLALALTLTLLEEARTGVGCPAMMLDLFQYLTRSSTYKLARRKIGSFERHTVRRLACC